MVLTSMVAGLKAGWWYLPRWWQVCRQVVGTYLDGGGFVGRLLVLTSMVAGLKAGWWYLPRWWQV